eukprot:9420934-Alexandrium_andersonii.AAC.1
MLGLSASEKSARAAAKSSGAAARPRARPATTAASSSRLSYGAACALLGVDEEDRASIRARADRRAVASLP